MKPILENNVLSTDLDCQFHDLLHLGDLEPVPVNLLSDTDNRLKDARAPLPGSVVNVSVSATAAIVQSKLNLNGTIPASWIGGPGVVATRAAQGNLAEFVSRKGAVNGYAPLDANGKIPVANVTPSGNPGTVTVVALSLVSELIPSQDVIFTSGTFSVSWASAPVASYLGIHGLGDSITPKPSFLTGPLPVGLIPNLPGTKFGSGTFHVEQLPIAIGIGPDHAIGMVPDPGERDEGVEDDYLGRDMTWRRFGDKKYQPAVPDPNIFVQSYSGLDATVGIRCTLAGSHLFYRIGPALDPVFIEGIPIGPDVFITVVASVGQQVYAYASKQGYNNSAISQYIVPPPPQ